MMVETLTLAPQLESITDARAWFARIAADRWGIDDYIPRLAVTELVTNSVRHSREGQKITVRAYERNSTHGLEVHDLCPDLPMIMLVDLTATSGRGLYLLSKLVPRIGVHPTLPGVSGKSVFVEFD
jgi:anti-sigma regulatory factor (Ser/Thr protein kinase)